MTGGGRPPSRRKPFTLIELIIVLLIMGILAAAASSMSMLFTWRAYESEVLSALSAVRGAQRTYRATYGQYPGDLTDLSGSSPPYIAAADFEAMKYVQWADMSVDGTGGSQWNDADGNLSQRYPHSVVHLSASGTISRS